MTMAEEVTPKVCLSSKIMNKLAKKTIRVNFFGTLETNGRLAALGECLIKGKSS